MAKVEALPAPQVIWAFRGRLDFYCYRGLYCVRSWPRRPTMPRSPASQASALIFSDLSKRLAALDPDLRAILIEDNKATGYTWKDEIVSAAYNKLNIW